MCVCVCVFVCVLLALPVAGSTADDVINIRPDGLENGERQKPPRD